MKGIICHLTHIVKAQKQSKSRGRKTWPTDELLISSAQHWSVTPTNVRNNNNVLAMASFAMNRHLEHWNS